MTIRKLGRRTVLQAGVAGAAAVSAPAFIRHAGAAAAPIKVGMPLALTGPLGSVGQQMKRGVELWAKTVNAQGGVIGRPIELIIEDTAGNPANCVRKAQEMVERHGVRIFNGIVLSSEALAVVPQLEEWNTIFISSDNGDGRLTAESFVPNFFRANISGPMGTRAVSLYLRQAPMTKFYAIGMDYAWGHNSVGVFEDEIKKAGKEFVGKVFSPTGTKDFSSYISKIRNSGAEAVFIVMQGDDNNAFLSQARQYRLNERLQMLTEIVDLASIRAVGEASLGLVGSSRYSFSYDHPANNAFVQMWQKEYGNVPDTFEGEQWQACKVLQAGLEKAGTDETAALRDALSGITIESVKGSVHIRECDHQGVQQGFMVKVVKREGFDHLVPEVIATFPGEQTTPPCRKMVYDD
ncbi:MAG: ABC transporter substrate-binding protein [Gammaproteobacteria bacterium]|nr:ABC transporter substrate-binding protein [Gammaproteobacteria bacterium]